MFVAISLLRPSSKSATPPTTDSGSVGNPSNKVGKNPADGSSPQEGTNPGKVGRHLVLVAVAGVPSHQTDFPALCDAK